MTDAPPRRYSMSLLLDTIPGVLKGKCPFVEGNDGLDAGVELGGTASRTRRPGVGGEVAATPGSHGGRPG